MSMFQKATKKAAKLRMSIAGPSGSGKTFTALLFAGAMSPNAKIAVVDTEHGSASKYADLFSFDVMELSNYHPNNYVAAIKAAVQAGYDVVVLDSITHAWNGPGGILSMVNQNFGKWKDVQPIEQAFIEAIVGSPIHIIATMRAKTQYEVEKDERTGKPAPKKVGMGAIQREGMEYEFDIAAMMDVQNTISIEKTRCSALQGSVVNRPDASFMAPVLRWLSAAPEAQTPVAQHRGVPSGTAPVASNGMSQDLPDDNPFNDVGFMDDAPTGTTKATAAATLPKVDRAQLNRLHAIGASVHGDNWDEQRHKLVMEITAGHAQSSNDLTPGEASELMLSMLGIAAFNGEWEGKADLVCKNAGVDALRKLNQADVNKLITRLENAIAGKAAGVPVTVGK